MASKIFGTLTLIALALAAFVGFKNKTALQNEVVARQEAEAKLEKTVKRFDDLTGKLAEARTNHEGIKEEIPKVEAQRDAQQKVNDELAASKAPKAAEVEANKAKLDQAREKTQSLGNIEDLATRLGALIEEGKGLEDTIRVSEGKLASLTSENTGSESQIARLREDIEKRSKGESLAGLETYISAVYPNWGFVTLGAGNTAGVITNSTLDVVRDDEVIAKLLVTAVERGTSSASIIPDTVKADITIQTGDRVVPGVKVATPPASAAPAPAN